MKDNVFYCDNYTSNLICNFKEEVFCTYFSKCIFKSNKNDKNQDNTYLIINLKDNTELKINVIYIIGEYNGKEIQLNKNDLKTCKHIKVWRVNK